MQCKTICNIRKWEEKDCCKATGVQKKKPKRGHLAPVPAVQAKRQAAAQVIGRGHDPCQQRNSGSKR